MITLYLRAPDGRVTCSSLSSDHGRIELDALTDEVVAISSPSTVPLIAIERVGRTEYIVRHVDDRLIRRGRARIYVAGRVLDLDDRVLVDDGEVIRLNEWSVRIGKPRLRMAPASIEEDFLTLLRQRPNDDATREVYADWLEENGALSAAMMLRLDVRVRQITEEHPTHTELARALRGVASDVEDDWRREVARPMIEACGPDEPLELDFECPKEWQKLDRGPNPNVRVCRACQKNVTYCTTISEARNIATAGGCVAVDPSLTRTKDDLQPPQLVLTQRMGMVRCLKI